jgi:hypothetical protein
MDELIATYIENTFHPELVDTIHRAFALMDSFQLPDYETAFINLLMVEDLEMSQNVQDHFTTILHQKLDELLHAHLIKPMEASHLHEKVGLLTALFNVQHLSDYTSIIHTLEASYDDGERLAEILSHCCELTPLAIENMIDDFNPSILETLKQYVYALEKDNNIVLTDQALLERKIIQNLRLFKEFIKNDAKPVTPLGLFMLESDAMVGQDLELYVPFVDAQLKHTDYPKLAVDVFSLLLLTEKGYLNPLGEFKKCSGWLLDDLTAITKVDPLIVSLSSAFEKFKHVKAVEAENV